MKNRVILEFREQVCFAAEVAEGFAKLFTEEEAIEEWGRLRREFPDFKFQIVVLRLGEANEFDRTD